MRQPLALKRDLGLAGFLTFQLVVGGTVLSALVHPFFLAVIIWSLAHGSVPFATDAMGMLALAALASGYGISAVLALIGLKRRRLMARVWVLLLMPVHWLMLSAAAWRAIHQLLRDPYRWEKTAHGMARTSRLAAAQHAQLARDQK